VVFIGVVFIGRDASFTSLKLLFCSFPIDTINYVDI